LPHPLKKPPVDGLGATAFAASAAFPLTANETAGVLGLARCPVPVDAGDGEPATSLRRASSLPLTSSNSCRATASAVFAVTSSCSNDSSLAGLWSSVERIVCMLRLLLRFAKGGVDKTGEAAGRPSLNSRRPVVGEKYSESADSGEFGSESVITERRLRISCIAFSSLCLSR